MSFEPDNLKIVLEGTSFDIFTISETKLDANNKEINIDGYFSYWMDHNNQGVLFCVFCNQLESQLEIFGHSNENVWKKLWWSTL